MADEAAIRLAIESGRVRTWADGFGRWHASVPGGMAFPMGVAKLAIRLELQDRAPRDTTVPMPKVERVIPDDGPECTCRRVDASPSHASDCPADIQTYREV